jgi:phosphocarrier protein HPr
MKTEHERIAVPQESRTMSSVLLVHDGGLHARPSIRVTQLAKRFAANVWIGLAEGGPWIDAKSIARVMAMKTPNNATLYFAADGEDAVDAVSALVQLVERDFANAPGDA